MDAVKMKIKWFRWPIASHEGILGGGGAEIQFHSFSASALDVGGGHLNGPSPLPVGGR